MPSQKTFRTKVKLAKAQKQNRYVDRIEIHSMARSNQQSANSK
jgi:ribosomal protein L39E